MGSRRTGSPESRSGGGGLGGTVCPPSEKGLVKSTVEALEEARGERRSPQPFL